MNTTPMHATVSFDDGERNARAAALLVARQFAESPAEQTELAAFVLDGRTAAVREVEADAAAAADEPDVLDVEQEVRMILLHHASNALRDRGEPYTVGELVELTDYLSTGRGADTIDFAPRKPQLGTSAVSFKTYAAADGIGARVAGELRKFGEATLDELHTLAEDSAEQVEAGLKHDEPEAAGERPWDGLRAAVRGSRDA